MAAPKAFATAAASATLSHITVTLTDLDLLDAIRPSITFDLSKGPDEGGYVLA